MEENIPSKHDHKAYMREYNKREGKATYEFCKAHHLCPTCGARAATGRVYCQDHREQDRIYQAERRARRTEEEYRQQLRVNSARDKARREARKAAGICQRCQKPVYSPKSTILCYEHYINKRRYMLDFYQKKHPPRIDTCRFCDEPKLPGQKVCKKHYDLACEKLEKARAAQDLTKNPFYQGNSDFWTLQKKAVAGC